MANTITANLREERERAALRTLFREGVRAGVLDPTIVNLDPGDPLDVVRSLFWACASDPSAIGTRDSAIFAALFGCGARKVDVVRLQRCDYDGFTLPTRSGAMGATGAKMGRGERLLLVGDIERRVPEWAAHFLDRWIDVRGDEDGPLFPAFVKATLTLRPLGDQAIYAILHQRCREAGWDAPTFAELYALAAEARLDKRSPLK